MQILTKEISTRTATFVSQIEQSAHLPVRYFDISARPNISDGVFGTVDTHPNDGIYKVWLQSALPQEPFEADLLHELRHILQVESGCSEVYNKDSAEFHGPNRAFIQNVGAHLSSAILDAEVNSWLTHIGYSQEYFSTINLDTLLSVSDHGHINIEDPLEFADLCLKIVHSALSTNGTSMQKICAAYSSYQRATQTASEMYSKLSEISLDNLNSIMLGHCLVVDSLNLWRYYYVATPRIRIRTHGEYVAFFAPRNTDRNTLGQAPHGV